MLRRRISARATGTSSWKERTSRRCGSLPINASGATPSCRAPKRSRSAPIGCCGIWRRRNCDRCCPDGAKRNPGPPLPALRYAPCGLLARRRTLVPVRRALVGAADAQHVFLVIAAADDLQRGRQAVRNAVWHRECAQVEQIGEPREMRRRLRLVDGIERDGGHRRRRREQRVEGGESRRERALALLTLGERAEIIARADIAARPDARTHVLVEREARIVHHLAQDRIG